MPTLDEVRAERARHLPPREGLRRGPFGGLLITDVARQESYDIVDRGETFEHNGEETYDQWYERLRSVGSPE